MMKSQPAASQVHEEWMKKRAGTAPDSGHGSEKGSLAGSWLESGSSDDGVDRGDVESCNPFKERSGAS